ncbi:hypothetical protein Pla163_33670 [Planctomycetes bacterium Pla163]|uniref:Right handed beta helix domain-containing protein n=1 Tax=Rohdeia mirabilis TaxID=2528008 RepID=A0A518D406_9BACT|nr:hypothetical protein Pla163_33670 [Planctomycetes bacterium Pla163]
MRSLLTLLAAVAASTIAHAQVTYVDASALGVNDGSSWNDAYTDLQDALSTTASGAIWIAAGTYVPSATGDRAATFQLVDGVEVLGGFAGGETTADQRDAEANLTVLSGDLLGDDTYGAGWNWWQFAWTGSLENSWHVVTGSGTGPTTVLDGVSIRAGRGDQSGLGIGAGLLVLGGSPKIRNCEFRYNTVGSGSSAYFSDSASRVTDCVIRDGYTCNCGTGGWTSGIICTGTSNMTFSDCEFSNHYYVSHDQGRGAALNIDFDASATLVRCRFVGNQTGNFYPMGGGTAYGAAVCAHGDVVVDRCEFLDNFAHAGAGLTMWGAGTVTNSLFARNEAVGHPQTSFLTYGDYGAGLLTVGFSTAPVVVTNCTFVDNNCSKGAGMAFYGAPGLVTNCIVYDNYADPIAPGEDPIFILKQNIVGDFDIANSCVEGLLQTEPGEDPPSPANFPGCIDIDPELVDIAGGVYRLAAGSPCIDSGDNAAIVGLPPYDLVGTARAMDDPATPDSGSGTAPIVDMGALEFGLTLFASARELSLAAGGGIDLDLELGAAYGGQVYVVLGSATGSTPGIVVDALTLPLVYDAYTLFTLQSFNTPMLQNTLGWTDGSGNATARFALPAGTDPSFVGTTLVHSALLIDVLGSGQASTTTNAVEFELVH